MQTQEKNFLDIAESSSGIKRRDFLKYGGIGVAATLVLVNGCKKDNSGASNPKNGTKVVLPAGDIGILNYAYALEQLEAAFYTAVLAGSYYANASAAEKAILSDIQKHEVCHVDFFKAALGSSAIIGLTPFFTNINFSDRTSVLTTAKAFEDLGVSAYNGAGSLIQDAGYLTLAGKIVSVEARHASAIRDLLSANTSSFAGDDIIDSNGLDGAKTPAEVIAIAGNYVTNPIDVSAI